MPGAIKFLPINVAGNGDNIVIAGVAGRRYIVTNYVLVAAGTVNVTFKSGTTALSGAMPLVVNSGVSDTGLRESPIMETLPGDAFIINLSAAVGVTGHIAYVDTGF